MLPVVVLALLCGLLAQNAQGYDNPQSTVLVSLELFREIISERIDRQALIYRLRNLPLKDTLKNNIKHSSGIGILGDVPIVGDVISNFYGDILGVEIRSVELLDLDVYFDGVTELILLTIPADLEVDINLPLSLGSLLRVQVSLEIGVGIRISSDPTDGQMRLVLGNCRNNPGRIRVTLLENNAPLLKAANDLLRIVTNVLQNSLPDILEKDLCPLVNEVLETILDLLQESFSTQVKGGTIKLSASTYAIHKEALEIGYQAEIQLPGGENYEIPPINTPLPDVPLSAGSSLNMLLSENLISSVIRSTLPPETIQIDNPVEVSYFNKQMQSIPEFSMLAGARIRSLKISYGTPHLSLTTGLVKMYQDMELKAFGDHQGSDNVNLFTIKMKDLLYADVSTDDLILRLIVKLQGLHGVSLVDSVIGTFDPLHLNAAMKSVLSNTFVPHMNSLLSGGCPLWLIKELGVKTVTDSIGKHMLLLNASLK